MINMEDISNIRTKCCDADYETIINRRYYINGFPMVIHRCLSCGKNSRLVLH
jgi:hypothetical protein